MLPILPEDQYWRGLLGSLTKCHRSHGSRDLTVITDVEKHPAADTNHVRSILDLVLEGFMMTVPAKFLGEFPHFSGAVGECPPSFRCAVLVVGNQHWYPGTHIAPDGTIPDRCEGIRLPATVTRSRGIKAAGDGR
jgi:hypothetical protein